MKIKVTDKEREELRAIFPKGYAKLIAGRLNDAGLKPSRSKEYTIKIVSDVLAGNQSDFNVLLELFRYKDEVLTKQEELKKLRKKKYEPTAQPVEKTQ
ncbi:hypothetical protein RM549_06085 [Salegentibacter sp. F188]|uniref:Uncharacterized protein n=1 Tax=Autumnicola patrickiae TaxID=3075591 RepID=A0ABU3E061_9FLAO|nr:hypothetical protein [Salegentibacter sp. F188]MDT0689346.1 hypothetical protein [Salegentibacter sp. F188]